jgi:hypothetical protein
MEAIAKDGFEYGAELVRMNDYYKYKEYKFSYGFTGFAAGDKENR